VQLNNGYDNAKLLKQVLQQNHDDHTKKQKALTDFTPLRNQQQFSVAYMVGNFTNKANNYFLQPFCKRPVSPAGKRQPIPRDPLLAVSYKQFPGT